MKSTFRILCVVCSLVISLSLLSLSGGAVSVSNLRWPLFPNGYNQPSVYDLTPSSIPSQWTTGLLMYSGNRAGYSYSLPGYVNIDAVFDDTGSPNLGPQLKYVFEFGKFGLNASGVYWMCFLLPSYASNFHWSGSATAVDSHIRTSPLGPTVTDIGTLSLTFDQYGVQSPQLWYARKAPSTYEPYKATVYGSYEWRAFEFSLEILSGYVNSSETDVVFVVNIDLDMPIVSLDGPDLAYPDVNPDFDNALIGFFSAFKPIFENTYIQALGLLFAGGFALAAFSKFLL